MGGHAQRFNRRLAAAVGLAALLMCFSVCLGKPTAPTVLVCGSATSLQAGQTCISADDSVLRRSEAFAPVLQQEHQSRAGRMP